MIWPSLLNKDSLRSLCLCLSVLAVLCLLSGQALATRIRDVARLSNELPNELEGMGLVVGLNGTGDGGDYLPTMRALREMMKRFDQQVLIDKELKSANNVAIVSVKLAIPAQGAHRGDKLDVVVSSIGAAKSLRGGTLFIVPMLAPDPNRRLILAHASGDVIVRDESEQKRGLIRNGGVLDADILPEEIGDSFTLALRPNAASMETASAIADQINEDVSPQTNGKPVAKALDGTTVDVQIPRAEQTNKTAFIARIRSLPLPNMPEPARVVINRKTKTIIFTEEVELAPTMISHGGLTITVTAPGQDPNPPGTQVPFVVLNTRKTGTNGSGMAKLRDLEAAFNLLKVSPDDRIAIVELLYATNVLKCTLDYE